MALALLSFNPPLLEALQRPNRPPIRLLPLLSCQAAKHCCWHRLFLHVCPFVLLTAITTSSPFFAAAVH
jgi:hypothetical protein